MKRLISLITISVLILTILTGNVLAYSSSTDSIEGKSESFNQQSKDTNTFQNSKKNENAKNAKDISIEKMESKEIFNIVNKSMPNKVISHPDGDFEIYDNFLFLSFVPENSSIFEVLFYNGKEKYVTISYFLDKSYIVVTYYRDGSIRKTVDNPESNEVISNFNNEYIEIHDKTKTIKVERSAEQLEEIQVMIESNKDIKQIGQLKNTVVKNDGKGTVIDIQSNDEVSILATKEVHPYPSDPLFMKYNAKYLASKTTTSQALANAGYNSTLYMKVYETMDYFTTINKETQYNPANTSVDVLMVLWKGVSKSTILGWLASYGVGVVSDKITEAINGVKNAEYQFYGGKEGTAYDRTRENAYVEVYSKWGKGNVKLVWDYDSYLGYYNPHWAHTYKSSGLETPISDIFFETERNYNANIEVYGVWKWGVGQLGY